MWMRHALMVLFYCLVCWFAYLFLIKPYSYRWRPCYGSKEYEVCMPHGFKVFGIDVSHHQGTIDWDRLALTGQNDYPIRFALVKATEGGDFKDENYDANIANARRVGMTCGSYLFFNPMTDPSVQASFFTSAVTLQSGDIPPVVDVEQRGESRELLQRHLLECLRLIERHYGVKPIIYTSYKFRHHYLNIPAFNDYLFWIAHYYVEKPDDDARWTLWQFTDRGRVDGISGYTDLNAFAGTPDEFHSILVK